MPLSFKLLSSENTCVDTLKDYGNILNSYSELYKQSQQFWIEGSEDAFEKYLRMCEGYSKFVELLCNDDDVRLAFLLMNMVFKKSSKHDNWRTFQLVYIANAIFNKVKRVDSELCDVIHVPTGGGKTEAYLGLLIFTFFYERILGHVTGTAAIVKFPLRMLSIQQMERVVQKIVFAECIRKEFNIPGEPISLGFYVGNSTEFPNRTIDEITSIRRREQDTGKDHVPGKILKQCPICNGDVCLKIDERKLSVRHYCTSCHRDLNLYYTDEEIYRFLPTLLVCTVDKFSTVALNRYAKTIFGCPICRSACGHGYTPTCELCGAHIGKNERCKNKTEGNIIEPSQRSVPSIIVQDELHLIRESFGTIDAHFESFCDTLQYNFTGILPKHIAMTATITGANEQIKQLYCKDTNVFPGFDPNLLERSGSNPFYKNEIDETGKPKLHRLIVGLRPNSRDNQYALNLTMRYAIEFIQEIQNGNIDLGLGRKLNSDEIKHLVEILSKYLTYHNKKGDVRSSKQFMKEVAGNEKGFDAIQKVLTGDNTVEEIRETMLSINQFRSTNSEVVHITSATNIVSHGIDIEDWNFMEFQGIPGNTAEYIQAQSRVGRKYCGLIFVWFYPTRVRDLSFYQNFIEYHKILDDMVEPVSINRWTKLGFMETCTSIMCATILNYISAIRGKPTYTQADIIEMLKDQNTDWTQKSIDFMNIVYKVDVGSEAALTIRGKIPAEVNQRLNVISKSIVEDRSKYFFPNILINNSNRYYGTQRGMRGIQNLIALTPDDETYFFVSGEDHD